MTFFVQCIEQVNREIAMHVISYSEARNSLKTVIDRVVNDSEATIIHRRTGGNAVVLSEAAYSSMVETLYLLSSPSNAAHLAESVAQYRAGKAQRRALLES